MKLCNNCNYPVTDFREFPSNRWQNQFTSFFFLKKKKWLLILLSLFTAPHPTVSFVDWLQLWSHFSAAGLHPFVISSRLGSWLELEVTCWVVCQSTWAWKSPSELILKSTWKSPSTSDRTDWIQLEDESEVDLAISFFPLNSFILFHFCKMCYFLWSSVCQDRLSLT